LVRILAVFREIEKTRRRDAGWVFPDWIPANEEERA
jgi:hypothetical protein